MDIDAEKIFEEINKIDENKVEPRDYSGQEYLFDTKKTYPLITDADHEIVVELSINLLKRNNEDIFVFLSSLIEILKGMWVGLKGKNFGTLFACPNREVSPVCP